MFNYIYSIFNRVCALFESSIDLHFVTLIKGAGCVMAEMWTRLPIMQGKVEQDQLTKIQKLCGGINPSTWPDVHKLPLYEKLTFPADVKNAKRILTQRLRF